MKIFKSKKGFTLIELLVVVAIIGVLASVVLSFSGQSRNRGADASVQSNLSTVRATSELFYLNNSNSYLPTGGATFSIATCPAYDALGTNMLSREKVIADAIAEATRRGSNSNSCYNDGFNWAVAVGLKVTSGTSWCVDNSGAGRIINSAPGSAINPGTGLCN